MSFRPIYFDGSPSDQGETCATHCSVSRELHLFNVLFCPTRTNQGHTGGGPLSSFYVSFQPHCPPAVLAFIFYREKGSAVPVPRKHQSRILSTQEAFQLFVVYRFTLPGTKKVRKKNTLAEIRTLTWLLEGYGDTN